MQNNNKILSLIGLSRRAGKVIIGQDNVFDELRKGKKLLVILTEDVSKSVTRKLDSLLEISDSLQVLLKGTDRHEMGLSLGLQTAQIVAFGIKNGFAVKIVKELKEMDRGVADE